MVTKIRDVMLDLNLVDIWRLGNSEKRYTWKQNKPLVQRRLEYWLINDDFKDDVDNTGIIYAIKTVVLQVNSVEKQPTGPSYWKFNQSSLLQDGELANSQKQGIIKLIGKKNKDKRYVANWRPISLLNVDVKIASKAVTVRLEKVLSDLISADQCAHVEGVNIFDALRTIGDMTIQSYTISPVSWWDIESV